MAEKSQHIQSATSETSNSIKTNLEIIRREIYECHLPLGKHSTQYTKKNGEEIYPLHQRKEIDYHHLHKELAISH